jgi:hypothetical protein
MATTRGSFPGRVLLLVVLAALGTAPADRPAVQDRFPHPAHARLFPLCAGCHAAAEAGGGDLYPPPALCANCHDGRLFPRVRWTRPAAAAPSFDHAAHARAVRGSGQIGCTTCHVTPGVARLPAGVPGGGGCTGCHATHRAESNCALCHAPAPNSHDRAVHAGCDRCHEKVHLDAQPHTRTRCLLCHQQLTSHAAPRNCVECHPVGRRG